MFDNPIKFMRQKIVCNRIPRSAVFFRFCVKRNDNIVIKLQTYFCLFD